MAPTVSKSAYNEQLEKFQAALQPTAAAERILRTLKEIQCFADSFTGHANRFVCSADLSKVLLNWMVQKQTADLATDAWQAAYELAKKYLKICHDAPDTIRSFCVTVLYNHVVALGTPSKLLMRLLIISLMARFEVTDEHASLFGRVKRVALTIVQDTKESERNRALFSTGHDVIIELHRKLLIHAARQNNKTRQPALDLFREVFDSSTAILQRFFGFSLAKAQQLYTTVMETMNADVKLRESELIHLFGDGIDFVEKILSFRDTAPEYCRFAEFFLMFKSLTAEPYASCVRLVRHLVRLAFSSQLGESFFTEVTRLVRSLYATFPSDPSVMKVIVLFACHSNRHFSSLPAEQLTEVAEAAIEMIESLMHFVRHCPTGMRAALCRRCPHARQHLADRLISALIHLASSQMKVRLGEPQQGAKHPKPTLTVGRVCELARRRVKLLQELECEGKGPLQNESVRYCVVWVQRTLASLRQEITESDTKELGAVLRLVIEQNAVQRYDFIKSDLILVRLLENCFYSVPSANVSTSALWPKLSVQLLKLLLTLRENPTPTIVQSNASIGVILRTIMAYQAETDEEDPTRTITVMQMYAHAGYDRFGFGFRTEPTHDEQLTIMVQEMTIATNYKTSRSITHCFDQLWKVVDVREHCLPLGMALYAFDEQEWEKLPTAQIDELRASLANHEPKTTSERFQRSAALGNISYRRILHWQRALLDRLRLVLFEREDIRNDRIDKMLLEIQFDQDAQLQERLEALRLHYRTMVTVLVEDDFQLISLLPSLTFVSSVLNNTARYYQLNYHPHQATELQLLNLLLVSQRRAERPLDQCVAIGFLLEYHQVTEDVLRQFPMNSGWPNFAGGDLGTLKALSVRAAELLHTFTGNESANNCTVPENRRYPLLDLYLTLAVYRGSKQSDAALSAALQLIRRGLAHADRLCAKGDLSEDSRHLMKGRAAQIVFRLASDYGLPFQEATPQMAFVRLMLGNFNELQKLCGEHTLILSSATVEMTVTVLQFMIVRYDTTQYIVGYVEQLLKFAMRRGAGLRVMQLLLLYGSIMVDSEKLDRCELAIRYLDRLLMLRPINSGKSHSKRVTRNPIDMDSACQLNQDFNRPVLSGVGNDDDDGARKVAKKDPEKLIMSNGGGTDPVDGQTEVPIEHYLMFGHAPSCDCRFCCNPQYKSMAFKTAALTARLAVLNREPIERTDHYYDAITDHWLSVMEPLLIWCLGGYRSDLLKDVMRTMVQRGLFLVRCGRYETARKVYERALALSDSKHIVVDRALYEDIRFNLQVLSNFDQQNTNVHQRKPSVTLESYKRFLATRNSSVATLETDLGKLQLKTPTKVVARGAVRPPPKTVDRVNELLRQSASRRYQRAQGVNDSALTAASIEGIGIVKVASASARKPKTVNIFMDSPPAPGRSRKTKKGSSENPAPVAPEKSQSDAAKISANVVNTKSSADPGGGFQQQSDHKAIGNSKPTQSVYVDFPVLHAANTPKRPGTSSNSNDNRLGGSPSLNGSFRDALVLGKSSREATKPPTEDGSVIVLDDSSSDIKTVSNEAIETSFVDSRTQTLTNSALALRTYSDRKRTANGGSTPLSAVGPSSAVKRKPPTVTKVRLRFDDPPTPERRREELQKDGTKQRSDKPFAGTDGNPRKAVRDRGTGPTGDRAKRANVCPPATEVIVLDCSAENAAPDNIATRTRQRRKRN
ncbi:uncharacterized protein LOC131207155 [Anopheles bellator]|uniref:uncharacterized protein LOC131207155 n=1 Tax=Anopheles bellator TaxID=139047 RepID=UPI0026483DD0|nr:uncharacterized protein LOC131207155 [Anopheles bellator]